MAYQAIYRKWRPLIFEDIVGQGHITKTLKNQIINNKIGHAYLFCGTRGTGKTTAAKVFARAVNCENPKDGSPCNECDVCKGILDGSVMDISEIDAASNNGVDNIRELRDDTKYASAVTKYRVYIIDEVHMLSSGAFNALLKTLEEPPEHVIFILATTEAQKIPQTILSRCQRFDFKRIRPADIILRFKEIAYGDGLNISDDAYTLLARLADGPMRDGLSVLERVAVSGVNDITASSIMEILSIADIDTEFKMADAITSGNSEAVFEIMENIVSSGKDLHVFINDLIVHFRNLLVCKLTKEPEKLLDYSSEEIVLFKSQAERITNERISFVIEALSTARAEHKWLKSPRVMYELALLRLCVPELDSTQAAISDRLAAVEDKIKNGVIREKQEEKKPDPETKPKQDKKKVPLKLYNPLPQSMKHSGNPIVGVAKKWDVFAKSIAKPLPHKAPALLNRNITIDADGIIILFDKGKEEFFKQTIDESRDAIQSHLRKLSGVDCALKTAYRDEIEDYIIDIWSLPAPPSGSTTDEAEPKDSDPLSSVLHDFEDVVEATDESEFLGYDSADSKFTQSEITNESPDDDDDREEFLEENELNAPVDND